MKTSLVVPAFNEEKALPMVIEEYSDIVDEIVVVDDGSSDRTYELAKNYDVKLYRHEKNMGKAAAIRTGIQNATGDIIILTDADYTYPARYVPQFVEKIEKGSDLVMGSRFVEGINNMSFLNIVGNKIFSFLTSFISCVNITDSQTGYRAFRKEMFDTLKVDANSLEFETKMTVRAAKLGYNVVEIPIEYRKRVGKSKLRPIRDGFRMFTALISVALTELPLIIKVVMYSSFILLIGSLYFGAVSISEMIAWKRYGIPSVHDYYPLLAVFLTLTAIQIFSFGLMFNYITKKLDRLEDKLRGYVGDGPK